MHPGKSFVLTAVLLVSTSLPALAQVERVVVEAEGISNSCRPGLETALKSLDSVYQYAISIPKQMFSVTYYKGEKFEPKELRWAADKGEAEILRMHVSAIGKVQEENGQQFFQSGDDRYQIVGDKKLPTDISIGIMGVVDDTAKPMTIKPDDFKVLAEETAAPEANAQTDGSTKKDGAKSKNSTADASKN
jgi:hypothetical protein